jgi:hypothetical protein
MLGELTNVNDGGGTATGAFSNVTRAAQNLATLGSNTSPGSGATAADMVILQNGSVLISGLTGTGSAQNFTVDFMWTMSATSTTSGIVRVTRARSASGSRR